MINLLGEENIHLSAGDTYAVLSCWVSQSADRKHRSRLHGADGYAFPQAEPLGVARVSVSKINMHPTHPTSYCWDREINVELGKLCKTHGDNMWKDFGSVLGWCSDSGTLKLNQRTNWNVKAKCGNECQSAMSVNFTLRRRASSAAGTDGSTRGRLLLCLWSTASRDNAQLQRCCQSWTLCIIM